VAGNLSLGGDLAQSLAEEIAHSHKTTPG
jgi:hypothetical protein